VRAAPYQWAPVRSLQIEYAESRPVAKGSLFLLGGCSALLIFSVLAFGAVETWATSVLELGAALLFLLWAAGHTFSGKLPFRWMPLYGPVTLFGVLVSVQIVFNLSAYRYVTFISALQYVAYGLLLFIAGQSCGDKKVAKILLLTFSIFGCGLALFAIGQYLAPNGRIFWLRTPRSGGAIFGPYVNHNHYAGMMEMLTPMLLLVTLSGMLKGAQRVLAGFATVIMAASIILSQSRGGTISLLAELLFLGWVASRLHKRSTMRAGLLLVGIFVIAFSAWLGTAAMWRHFGDLQDNTRITIIKDGLHMFARKPLLGWGLGVFPVAYPQFRSFYTNLLVNAAHNDYLQILIETGIAGFVAVAWFLICLYRGGLRQVSNWTRDWNAMLRLAALVGCTGIVIHSLFDFNLQIPANAAMFFFLSAIAVSGEQDFVRKDVGSDAA
jgi:O-antigen ligase